MGCHEPSPLFTQGNDHHNYTSLRIRARYRLQIGQAHENQSSSGIIVATGAGSTGWLRSVYAGAAIVVEAQGGQFKCSRRRPLPPGCWPIQRVPSPLREKAG